MLLKLISWNVNGVRAVNRRGGFAFLKQERPHLVCLQETRAGPGEAGGMLPDLPYQEWHPARRPGYSGTAVFSRVKPVSVRRGVGTRGGDDEGRVLTIELEWLFVVSVYAPNSRRDLSRLAYRQSWDRAFLRYLLLLESRKPVLFCGDLNVAHEEIDLARPKENHHTHGFTDEERSGFTAILRKGFIDTFRELHPEGGNYTWWSVATGSRERNLGWRIDYVLISKCLRTGLRKAFILPRVRGSDHCPVGVALSV